MATITNQQTNKPPPSDPSAPRWTRSGDQSSTSNGTNRSSRGRSGRVRNGGKSHKPREDKISHHDNQATAASSGKIDKPAPPTKPTLSITPPSNHANTNDKPKNSSRRPSRANSSISTSQTSPVAETPVTPSSARSLNRRKRSGTGKGNSAPQLSKIIPPAPHDDLLSPGRPRHGPIPHSAPPKDTPPHLSQKSSRSSYNSFDMSKDIDALVERVRAVAMAENRPSTPGSHIDWAGDDDDSLPDLDDWGIPSLTEQRNQTISPIIVGALKPLPEPTSLPVTESSAIQAPPRANVEHSTSQDIPSQLASSTCTPTNDNVIHKPHPHPSLPPKPHIPPNIRIVNEIHKPMASRRSRLSEEPISSSVTPSLPSQSTPSVTSAFAEGETLPVHTEKSQPLAEYAPQSILTVPEAQNRADEIGSGGLSQSIYAPSAEERAESKGENGLMVSIHAPSMVDSISTPAQPGGQSPKNRNTHVRAHTVGRTFPRPNYDDNNPFNHSPRVSRGPPHKSSSPKQHIRNYSLPSTTTSNHRPSHSRPVLTGDAISRLVKTIGSTGSAAKATPVAND